MWGIFGRSAPERREDGEPCRVHMNHPAAAAILAAIEYRDRTGKGQYIDASQFEATLHFLAPAMLEYAANGNPGTRMGNASPYFA
ncbi:MAG: CoA transferase, partial [Firmicutes bacterium]|nr:CoA transferase [Bacillota bacterium]